MNVVERGRGEPLVVVPGVQGRWEWIADAVDALAEHYRVLTFSLGDEPSAEWTLDSSRGMDGFADQIDAALDSRGIDRAFVCGISFGGLVALRHAARAPERVAALALVSAPGPGWHLKARHDFYARHPRFFAPFFAVESLVRMQREIRVAHPALRDRWSFARQQLDIVAAARPSVVRMAARARLIALHDRDADCGAVRCPTLVMHGEPDLDHVVDAGGTREYAARIAATQLATLPRTGHLGFSTRPREFATLVSGFVAGTGIRLQSIDAPLASAADAARAAASKGTAARKGARSARNSHDSAA